MENERLKKHTWLCVNGDGAFWSVGVLIFAGLLWFIVVIPGLGGNG
jgi:hypothetical protein